MTPQMEIKTLFGKQVLADKENRNSFPYETEEEKEITKEFLNKMENKKNGK